MDREQQLEARRQETVELMHKVRPLFDGVHSFTMMMVIADLEMEAKRNG